jgi:PAS domain S-box-containing protein
MYQLNQEYEDLFNFLPVGCFILDRDGKIQRANERASFYLGIDREYVKGTLFSSFLLTELHQEIFLRHRDTALTQGQIQQTESEIRRQDGRSFPVLIKSAVVKDQQGSFKQMLTTVTDISKIKAHEQGIEAALFKEKQLNEIKSSFVSIASHEFRTPLSAVLSSTSLVEQYAKLGAEEKMQKHLNRIKSSVKVMVTILEEFLSLEKLESGKVEVIKTNFFLTAVCDDMIEEVNPVSKQGQYISYFHKGLNEVTTDIKILQHILLNLLSNACKYSEQHQEIVVITEANAERISIQVKDCGVGIPEEEQDKIFSRFFRAANVVSIQGTGLGLSIVKRYVELLNGTIYFISQINEGTTFYVDLPNQQS